MEKVNQSDVKILPETDLNNCEGTTSESQDETESASSPKRDMGQINEKKRFSSKLFDDLPKLLREPCSKLNSDEREVFLVGALGVISGILPNFQGKYFGKIVEPNLYCYILGKYGIGKGGLNWVRILGEEIHRKRVEEAKGLIEAYKTDMVVYKKDVKLFERGKIKKAPIEPTAPPHFKLFIPDRK